MTIDVSVGAIGAAIIAGLVSLIGLIISKEQKTSEFRQTWIDDLRKEIITFTTNINSVADALTAGFSSQQEKVKILSPLYSALNSSAFAIKLRLNPEEKLSMGVLSCLGQFKTLFGDENMIKPDKIRPIENDLLDKSADLLKGEWVRVKTGERTFRFAKVILAVFVILAVLLLILALIFGSGGKEYELSKPPFITNVVNEVADSLEPRADAAEQKLNAVGTRTKTKQKDGSTSHKTVGRSPVPRKGHSSVTGKSLKCLGPRAKQLISVQHSPRLSPTPEPGAR